MSNNEYNFINTFRQTPIILVIKMAFATLIFNILYLITSLIGDYLEKAEGWQYMVFVEYESLTFIILILLQIIFIIYVFMSWYYDSFTFDGEQVTHKTGLLFKREVKYNLQNVDEIKVRQTPIGTMLHFGDLVIKDSLMEEDVVLKSISNPQALANHIHDNVRKSNLLVYDKLERQKKQSENSI